MGFIDSIKQFAQGQPIDDIEYEEEEYQEEETMVPARPNRSVRDRYSDYRSPDSEVLNINTTTQLQVVLVKPERFENASEIADHLGSRHTVVLNLESASKEVAGRLLDFLSGVAYANGGQIKKVAISTFIITPFNVDIQGDLLDELESSGLFF